MTSQDCAPSLVSTKTRMGRIGKGAVMRLLAVISALMAMAFSACAQPVRSIVAVGENGTSPVFVLRGEGWVLSSSHPRFPYEDEGLVFSGMSGAATATPFGCGLADIRYSYFAGQRGRLACVSRGPDGRLRLTRIADRTPYSRVYDAADGDGGHIVIARSHRSPVVRVMTLSGDGSVLRSVNLPFSADQSPDQVVILASGRLAALRKDGRNCEWVVLERAGPGFRTVSVSPADHLFQCQSHARGTGVIRDQFTGDAYLRQYAPDKNALYRIGDNGDASPATLAVRDIAATLPMDAGSQPRLVTVLNGALLFEAPSVAGPVIVHYELVTGRLSRTDLRASSGRWSDSGRVHGFMLAGPAGDGVQVVVMTPTATTEILPVARD